MLLKVKNVKAEKMSNKKKFKDTTVGQLLFGAASVINPTLGNVLQGVTTPQEAIAEITKSDAPQDDKIKLQQIIYEQQNKEIQAITSRWEADAMSDSWLRPSDYFKGSV